MRAQASDPDPATRTHHLRARIGGATLRGNTELAEQARVELRAHQAEQYIRQLVDSAPPLSASQRERLSLLLHPGGAHVS